MNGKTNVAFTSSNGSFKSNLNETSIDVVSTKPSDKTETNGKTTNNELTTINSNGISNHNNNKNNNNNNNNNDADDTESPKKRDSWGHDLEFLMSCIALSVGLGNVWRFPFTALENGGGAFIIPYLVVLFLVGKPIYYLEMLVGQFSGRGSINVYDISPLMRGIGYGQLFSVGMLLSYYSALLAIIVRYFVASLQSILPWSVCEPEWGDQCIDSTKKNVSSLPGKLSTSAEHYFYKVVLNEKSSIDDGLGTLDWKLVVCLLFSWFSIFILLMRGIKSSGKASYFLALFPYVTMAVLFVRAVTLPGAHEGIMYFLTPQWDQLLNPNVWFAAVSQCFFSIAVCFSLIIMYSSYNRFDQNIYKDTFILTLLDTFTSMISGIIIFGILGNLVHESGAPDIKSVVKGGTGVAFVSYPDAISKMEFIPQLFAATFFFMLFILAVGSNVGMSIALMTAIRDKFKQLSHIKVAFGIAVVQFCIGLLYCNQGGQHMLTLVDYFGVSMVIYVLAIAELITLGWIYGVSRICKDTEFMLGIKTSFYWRICWGIIAPGMMICILIYQIVEYEPLKYNDYQYPVGFYVFGWCLSAIGILQLPIWAAVEIYKQEGATFKTKLRSAIKPNENWGPLDSELNEKYKEYMKDNNNDLFRKNSLWSKFYDNIFK